MPPTIAEERFPFFVSHAVPYRDVRLTDAFWAPRQRVTREVTLPWVTAAHDGSGGLGVFAEDPTGYRPADSVVNMEAIKFLEAMATVVGVARDADVEGLIDAWGARVQHAQGDDGYLATGFPAGFDRPAERWQPVWWSHEDYTIGHYLEAALAYRDATGSEGMYRSALRAVDQMVDALGDGIRPYAPGHPEIEQALMRLYSETGDERYVRFCGWLLGQRGHAEGRRPGYGRMRQDDVPIVEQRTIQGHAVMAGYLFTAVTQYVGATGDPAYREAVLAIWDDFAEHKMYLHGAGGNVSSRIEGYRKEPYCILPEDAYGESCSIVANFQWAHSLAGLTGDARYLDVAERMLYNAFPAALSLTGDASFYCNVAASSAPSPRKPEFATSCCPPNIVKLINKVGGYFYSTDAEGILVNHYGASDADIAWSDGVRLSQSTAYPWDGRVRIDVDPATPSRFALRLRLPGWAASHAVAVNGEPIDLAATRGWLTISREWAVGDQVTVDLPMDVRRASMPPEFREYQNRAALERGPIVYCLEELDVEAMAEEDAADEKAAGPRVDLLGSLYLPEDGAIEAEHLPEFLGGVTVLRGEVRQMTWTDLEEIPRRATFIPYGVWNNREPGAMRIWLGARKTHLVELLFPEQLHGESCVG